MPTQDKRSSHTRSTGQISQSTHQLINSSTQKTPARQLKKSKNLQPTSFPTHQLENLNYYLLFYNIAPIFAPF